MKSVESNSIQAFFDSELFHFVQTSGLFVDSKTFADAIPINSFEHVLNLYQQQQNQPKFDLKTFVTANFRFEEFEELTADKGNDDILKHITHLWSVLKKPADGNRVGSLIPLPQSYTVPGGRFREVYYWDSFFAAIGLMQAGREQDVFDIVDNFISLQQRVGTIPNGNRWYYASRSQPPVLAMLVNLLQQHSLCSKERLVRYREAVETEYLFWMAGSDKLANNESYRRVVKLEDGSLLNRFYDDSATPRPESYAEDIEMAAELSESEQQEFYRNIRAACESGWDFSSRWFKDANSLSSIATTEIIPIDLNCILYFTETWLTEAFGSENLEKHQKYKVAAQERKTAINRYLWSDSLEFYTDYWFKQKKQSNVLSLAALWPLYFGMASQNQAKGVAQQVESKFLKSGGLITTQLNTGEQWDSPNGWAPLHWVSIQGLKQYGFDDLASKISTKWIATVTQFFNATGKLMEKYNVVAVDDIAQGGEYDVQEGFGWTNGVTQALLNQQIDQ